MVAISQPQPPNRYRYEKVPIHTLYRHCRALRSRWALVQKCDCASNQLADHRPDLPSASQAYGRDEVSAR